MKGRLLGLTIAFIAVPAATASAQDPFEGQWRVVDNDRVVEIAPGTRAPLEGHTVSPGNDACGTRDVDLRLTPQGGGRYTGLAALYRIVGGVCEDRIEDARIDIELSGDSAHVVYTIPPSAPPCVDCDQQWVRVSASPGGPAEPVCTGRRIRGTAAGDRLSGTSLPERIFGLRGSDAIAGRGGGDCIFGGSGDDRMRGGSGNDKVVGGRGDDRVAGNGGNDWLRAGGGLDTVIGGAGHDAINLRGPGAVRAGSGDDVINARNGDANHVSCGRGADTVRADRRDTRVGCESVRFG